jgi:glycosyltransferase involved in cell wall biosynthesis
MSNQQAIIRFSEAREHCVARRFHDARAAMRRYRKNVQYEKFTHADQRETLKPEISVVIVSYGTGHGLIECLETVLKQQGPPFEIVVVDNGGNEPVHEQLGRSPILWISPPVNLLPSEGRNVGAHFAQSELLVFLDDDALMEPGYLAAAKGAMADQSRIGLRGRIKPKTPGSVSPPHYDLGELATNSEFNLEGNIVIRKPDFATIGGFDPLMFGHEGKALTHHARLNFPKKNIQYRSELVIKHDWANDEQLARKLERQSLGRGYLDYLNSNAINYGVSIVIRVDENFKEVESFLKGLVKYNSYKPVEVLLWAKDSKQALALARLFINVLRVSVLPAVLTDEKDAVRHAKYENVLIIIMPYIFEDDLIEKWIFRKRSDIAQVSVCTKNFANETDILHGSRSNEKITLNNGEKAKEKNIVITTHPLVHDFGQINKKSIEVLGEKNFERGTADLEIEATEQQIHEIMKNLSMIEREIEILDTSYLNQKEHDPVRNGLSKQLEIKIIESSRLMMALRVSNVILHELRIRKFRKTT